MRTTRQQGWFYVTTGGVLGAIVALALAKGVDQIVQTAFMVNAFTDETARSEGMQDVLHSAALSLGTVVAMAGLIGLVIIGIRTLRGTLVPARMNVHDYREVGFDAGASTSILVGLLVWGSMVGHQQITGLTAMLMTVFFTVCGIACTTLASLVLLWYTVLESGFRFFTQSIPDWDSF